MVVTIFSDFQIIPCFFAWQIVPLPTAIIYRSMILETEIDGLLYSLDTDEQVATVVKCVNREHTGKVVIPESFFYEGIVYMVTIIGEKAFAVYTHLTTITIPEGVTKIGISAFDGCSSLTVVTIPKSVTSIEERAFAYCI